MENIFAVPGSFFKCKSKVYRTIFKHAISHCRDSIENKLVTAVDDLKEPDCGNATDETEKDASRIKILCG